MNIIDQIYRDAIKYYNYPTALETYEDIHSDTYLREYDNRRFYHTETHVRSMLDEWNRYVDDRVMSVNLAVIGSIAIIYHDIVYNPTRKDNELQSAKLMRSHLGSRLSAIDLDRVEEMILQTQHTDDTCNIRECNIIRDIDLRGLGGSEPEYRRNVWQIRQEYMMFSQEEFLEGRTKFLNSMFSKERIFRTDRYEHLEARARLNMSNELKMLETPDKWKQYYIDLNLAVMPIYKR